MKQSANAGENSSKGEISRPSKGDREEDINKQNAASETSTGMKKCLLFPMLYARSQQTFDESLVVFFSFPPQTTHGKYSIEDILFASGHAWSGFLYHVSLLTVDGEFKLTLHPVSPIVSRENPKHYHCRQRKKVFARYHIRLTGSRCRYLWSSYTLGCLVALCLQLDNYERKHTRCVRFLGCIELLDFLCNSSSDLQPTSTMDK